MPDIDPIASTTSNVTAPAQGDGDVELPRGTTLDRYVIVRCIGRGGMGAVYLAFDGELDRRVAIKLLRTPGSKLAATAATELRQRLVREAQALAKVSHPNVVAIFDVGTFDGEVFLAMEYVEGRTLRQWQADRSVREILHVYDEAGRGLEAAHAAGIIHRDFKPENVLVDDAGRVKVVDFGIAGLDAHARPRAPMLPDAVLTESGRRALSSLGEHLTELGAVLGTPSYMAPEQKFGERTSVQTDQYSFCVALYEALYGTRPVAPEEAPRTGRTRVSGRRTKVPANVRRALTRGLREEAADRYPSMTALLAELQHDRARELRGRAWTGATIAGIALVALLLARARVDRPPVCAEPDETLGGAWTPAVRDRVGALFARTAPYGAPAYEGLAREIDRYAGAVAHMRREACEAARVRGTESDSVMTLRLQCLDERSHELASLVQLLGSADAKLVDGAGESMSRLSPVAACANVTALTAPVPPPTPAVAAQVEGLRGELAEVRALMSAARYAEASRRAMELAPRADALHYLPLVAEVRYELGNAVYEDGKAERGEQILREAIDAADQGKHDLVRGQAYLLLARILGRELGNYAAAIAAARSGLSVARRLDSEELEAGALSELGIAHGNSGHIEESLDEARQALAIAERLEGSASIDVADMHIAVSIALSELGRLDEAQREDRRALEILEHNLGHEHPRTALALGNLSVDLVWAGRAEEAVAVAAEAVRIGRASLGPERPKYATLVNDESYALTKLGRFAEALPLNEEAVAISEKSDGTDASSVAYPMVGLGEDLLGLGRAKEALPRLERATRIAEVHELDPETMGECHYHLARAAWRVTGDGARAAVLAQRAADDYARSPRLADRAKAARELADRIRAGEREE